MTHDEILRHSTPPHCIRFLSMQMKLSLFMGLSGALPCPAKGVAALVLAASLASGVTLAPTALAQNAPAPATPGAAPGAAPGAPDARAAAGERKEAAHSVVRNRIAGRSGHRPSIASYRKPASLAERARLLTRHLVAEIASAARRAAVSKGLTPGGLPE